MYITFLWYSQYCCCLELNRDQPTYHQSFVVHTCTCNCVYLQPYLRKLVTIIKRGIYHEICNSAVNLELENVRKLP